MPDATESAFGAGTTLDALAWSPDGKSPAQSFRCAVIVDDPHPKPWQIATIAGLRALECDVDVGSLRLIEDSGKSYEWAFDLLLRGEPVGLRIPRCWWLEIGEPREPSDPLFFEEIVSGAAVVQAKLLRRISESVCIAGRLGTFELRATARRTMDAIWAEVAYWSATLLQIGEMPKAIGERAKSAAPTLQRRLRFADLLPGTSSSSWASGRAPVSPYS